jgi:beta-N-acetylhexosaminidase
MIWRSLLARTDQDSSLAHASRGSTLSLMRWFVVMTLMTGLLATGYGLVRPGSRIDQPGTPSPVPMTPAPSLPSGPAAVEAETVAFGETIPQPAQVPEGEFVPATALPTPAWQPLAVPSDQELEAMVAGMSLQDRVAQMVMVGFQGQSLATSPELETMVGAYHVGGVVLIEANAHDPRQLGNLTAELQSLAASTGAGIPLFIAINHEGGIVVRITEGVTGFPGNMAVAATGRPEYAYTSAALAAQELRAMGVNMNLAPVLDVNDNPLNPVIGTRSFGESPALAAEYGRLAVRGSQDNGVIAVAKHFPGHGSVGVDSHGALPVLQASVDQLDRRELVPFRAAIEDGVAGIMTAHIAVPAVDESGRPATLSPEILTGLLRQQMGYDGLIVTDSLGMGAVSAGWGQAQAAVEAVRAGADIVLSTTPMEAHIAMVQALVVAVQQGDISVERIDQSVLRILRVKRAYGLFERSTPLDLTGVGSAEHQAIAGEIARRAVTILRDDGDGVPLPPPPARLLLISPSQLPPAASASGTLFAELLRERGYEVNELVFNLDSGGSRDYVYASAVAQAATYEAVVFGEWELIKRYVNWDDRWQEDLVGALHQAGCAPIVVAWHNPAAILRCPQVSAFLTAYGNTRAQVAVVVAALSGEQVPEGRLPVTLPGVVPNE